MHKMTLNHLFKDRKMAISAVASNLINIKKLSFIINRQMTNIFEYNYLIYKKQSLLVRSLSQKKNMDKEFEQRKQRQKAGEKD